VTERGGNSFGFGTAARVLTDGIWSVTIATSAKNTMIRRIKTTAISS